MLAHTCIGLQHQNCSMHMPPSRARRPAASPHRRPCTPAYASQRERPASTSRSCTACTRTASRARKRPHVCIVRSWPLTPDTPCAARCRCCCSPALAPRLRRTSGIPRKCPELRISTVLDWMPKERGAAPRVSSRAWPTCTRQKDFSGKMTKKVVYLGNALSRF